MTLSEPFSYFVPCTLVGLASLPLLFRLVPPNRYYGVRTRKTLADRATWFRVNRFAGGALLLAELASMAIYAAVPAYASGRSLAGLAAFLLPLAAAIAASVGYAGRAG